MELDPVTKLYKGDLGSFSLKNDEYIKKFFYDGEYVNLYFDVDKDVEDWEYSAIYDVFPYDRFEGKGFIVSDIDDEYNPSWNVKIQYISDREKMQETFNELMDLIQDSIEFTFNEIKIRKDDYT